VFGGGGCVVGGAAFLGSMAVCVVLVCSLGESLLGGACSFGYGTRGVVATSRLRVSFRMCPRHRSCRGVVQSWLSGTFRLRRRLAMPFD